MKMWQKGQEETEIPQSSFLYIIFNSVSVIFLMTQYSYLACSIFLVFGGFLSSSTMLPAFRLFLLEPSLVSITIDFSIKYTFVSKY